jgi:plastocyanin
MRLAPPSLAALIALLACLAMAGCASPGTAGWTFAPPPSPAPTPAVSAAASGSPVAGGSAAPSASAAATGSPVTSGSPLAGDSAAPSASAAASGGTADVTISALNIAFEQSSVNAPAGKAFTILFDNKDAGVPHNVWIKDASGTAVFQGAIVTGPVQTTYHVQALAAGSYTFVCSLHANMIGAFVVQ